jgi:hypothetical protein
MDILLKIYIRQEIWMHPKNSVSLFGGWLIKDLTPTNHNLSKRKLDTVAKKKHSRIYISSMHRLLKGMKIALQRLRRKNSCKVGFRSGKLGPAYHLSLLWMGHGTLRI